MNSSTGTNDKILITGATGLIGRALVEHFMKKGKKLKVQVRDQKALRSAFGTALNPAMVEICQVDFTQASTNDFNMLTSGVGQIIHAAGLVHQPNAQYSAYDLLNVRTTETLIDCASRAGTETFLFLSSSSVYGDGPFENVIEDTPLKPITPYGVSKVQCEKQLKSSQKLPKIVVLRPSMVYGEGDRGNLLSLIRQIKKGRYFHIGSHKAYKSLIYAKDLALAIELCLNKAQAGYHVYNAANPNVLSVRELAEKISRALGQNSKLATFPEKLVRLGAKTAQTFLHDKAPVKLSQIEKLTTTTTCSVQKLVADTGFSPAFSVDDSLAREIKWAEASRLI